MGSTWLGVPLTPGKVLWVGPDEHLGDVVSRFRSLDVPADRIEVWVAPDPDTASIAAEAERFGADVIVLDTLSRIARVKDENDNARASGAPPPSSPPSTSRSLCSGSRITSGGVCSAWRARATRTSRMS